MNKKNYIDKIELILNTSGKYITRKEKDMILDYVNYFKTKNNVIEDKNIELVIEIERLKEQLNDEIEEELKQSEIMVKKQEEIERLNKGLDELEELCKTKYYEKNTTDIDSIVIAGNLYVYMYKKIKELKGSDRE